MNASLPTDRIARLPCFTGEVQCTPLPGGITNHNYRVSTENGEFVVRFCDDLAHLGIHRRNEALCQRLAAEQGVAPEVVYRASGVLVTRFLAAKTCTAADLQTPEVMERVVSALRTLHAARRRLAGALLYFCPFQIVRTYAETAGQLEAKLPENLAELLADAAELQDAFRPFQPTLCHNDLLPANLLDDGQRVWLIDWEYAGMGNRLFDLANLAINARLNADQERQLLQAHTGTADAETLRELQVLKTVSLLREVLWAVIQTVKSTLDFDYPGYAAEHLHAYRQARDQLNE